ncbi:MAG: acetyl-CoA acetyltransferase [bacterium]|nr:acetyl-CoA acetyltransferase [bacterium]
MSMVSVVFSPVSRRPAAELAELLDLSGVEQESTTPGGNIPQWLVTRAAADIAQGRLDTTLLAGAEATRSLRAADPDVEIMRGLPRKAGPGDPDPVVGTSMEGMISLAELSIRLFRPIEIYALFESAFGHKQGRNFEQQRQALGPLMSRFSEVAAGHPHAWFQQALSPKEISQVSDVNRLVVEPYPKQMNAFPNVDQSAAVIVTSLATARELGLEDRCIFVWSGANTTEPAPVTRRDLADVPAMRVASAAALDAAGAKAEELSLIDLYSCFPVAVEASAAALGVELDDPRDLTVTGGLPFFGGPGNNYSMHAIATLSEQLREVGGIAYVGANGGLLSKHAIGIYGATPAPQGFVAADTRDAQAEIEAAMLPFTTEAEGIAEVVASTVVYGRDGSVQTAPVIASLEDGRRVVAEADESIRESLAGTCLIGERVQVAGSPLSYRV